MKTSNLPKIYMTTLLLFLTLSLLGQPLTEGEYYIKNTYPGQWNGGYLSWDQKSPHPMGTVELNDPVVWYLKPIGNNNYMIQSTFPGPWQDAFLSWDDKPGHPMISVEFCDQAVWSLQKVNGSNNKYKIVNVGSGHWNGASISWDSSSSHPMASLEHHDPVEWEITPVTPPTSSLSRKFYIKNTYPGQWNGALLSWDNKNPHPRASVEFNDPVEWFFAPVPDRPNHYKIINTYPGEWQGASLSYDVSGAHPMISVEFRDPVEWRLDKVSQNLYKIVNTFPGEWYGASISWDSGQDHPMASLEFDDPVNWKLETPPANNDDFNMILASDPQYPWTPQSDAGGDNRSESTKKAESHKLNTNHVKSMNSLIGSLGNFKGAIINGDLTAFGHKEELDVFKEIYGKLNTKMYLGLGNHDYANNVNNTYENVAVNSMTEYMIDHIKTNGSTNSDYHISESYEFPNLERKTRGSLSYSWDIGNIHFVQLQNFPTYVKDWSNYVSIGDAKRKTVDIISSMNWLENDLARARNAGRIIVLNFHDWGPMKDNQHFKDLLAKYSVAVIFVGHIHTAIGNTDTDYIGNTPVYFCGSSSQEKYLFVRFKGNKMTTWNVGSAGGGVNKYGETNRTLFDKAVSIPIPREDKTLTFFNEAGYIARYTLSYNLNGERVNKNTGDIALGNKRSYTIPRDAICISVKGEGNTGLFWEPWRTTFSESFRYPKNVCYKSYGTTLHQNWSNDCN